VSLRRLSGLLFVFSAFLFSGCVSSLKAVVYDANGLQKEVYRLTTNKGGYIEILDGLAVRKIRLNKISLLTISPKEATSFNGELYYLTEIWLSDGNKIQSYLLPDGRRSGAYVNINSLLMARTTSGDYSIKFKDIKQVRFIQP
jgi:hypothetical protein